MLKGIILLGLREYISLLTTNSFAPRKWPLYLAAISLLIAVGESTGLIASEYFPALSESVIIIFFVLVITIQTIEVLQSPADAWLGFSAHLAGFVWVACFASTFILIRELSIPALAWPTTDIGYHLTLALFVSVWICDSCAYLFGKRFGKTKLLPKVSPKKTVVGTVSGILGALLVMLIVHQAGWLAGLSLLDAISFGLIAGVFGQLGDFVESRLKRDMGVKDTGKLLPGHGGILDRFDSLLFVMPISYLYISLCIL